MRRLNLLPKYILVAILLSVALVSVTAFSLYAVYRNSLAEAIGTSLATHDVVIADNLSQQALIRTQRLAVQLAAPMAADQPAEIEKQIGNATRLTGARTVLLLDASGRPLIHTGDIAHIGTIPAVAEGATIESGLITSRAPVIADGETIGTIVQTFDVSAVMLASDRLETELGLIRTRFTTESLVFGLAIALLATFFTCVIAAAFAWRQVRAIRTVAHGAARVARGQFEKSIPIHGFDELGQLAESFNAMNETLRDTVVSRDFLDRVLSSIRDAIILTSEDGRITRVNAAALKLLNAGAEGLVGSPLEDYVAPEYRSGFVLSANRDSARESMLLTADGEPVPVSYSISEVAADDPELHRFIIVARNITDRKLAERRIRYLARVDALTKVSNRMQFQHLLQRAIARARRDHKTLALLYLDVDRFKDINDTFGHGAGDACLETLTERLAKALPETAIIGRLAGDEFGVILNINEPEQAQMAWLQSLIKSVLADASQVLITQGREVYMSVSAGIARYPRDATHVPDLIRNADAALYQAKRAGGNTFEFYDPSMNAQAVERLMLKSKLRRSYELDELLMNYQPKIDLRTGEIAGAEALVRWDLSEHGLVLPSEFIPLAEETNLILEIGEWVLNRVCEDYRSWELQSVDPGRVSVNLSLKQLGQRNFSKRVRRIFRKHEVNASSLELEITESTLMKDVERTVRILGELHDMGLFLAIDDFGTGYSSLSALQQFPISTLKIDKSFVRHACSNSDDATIVSTIIDMGHSLNMQVVAEGVESEDQLEFLKSLNCDYVQGLLFGKPIKADEYLEMIAEQQSGGRMYKALLG